jgi:murein DD-endopeptidase MepM/ murein hydrolase activator NlpD
VRKMAWPLAGIAGWLFALAIGPVAAGERFQRPVDGGQDAATCVFNDTHCAKEGWYHTAVDYVQLSGIGDNVFATSCGTVEAVVVNGRSDHGFGNCVILRHHLTDGNVVFSLYGHLSSVATGIGVGTTVQRGQIIGQMGGTGYGEIHYWSKHLHFEMKNAPVLSNPSNGGPYWGYTPTPAQNYGYLPPADFVLGSIEAECP